jgi:hypothetical protein
LSACQDANLVSCRRINVDFDALNHDSLLVPDVGVIVKTRQKEAKEEWDDEYYYDDYSYYRQGCQMTEGKR